MIIQITACCESFTANWTFCEKNYELVFKDKKKGSILPCGLSPVWIRLWVFRELEVLNPLPHTEHTWGFSPVWTRVCRFNKLGRSKAFPQISQGSRFLSPRAARCFGGATIVVSIKSPELLLPDDTYESPEIDFRSSSVMLGDEIGGIMSATSDIDKSSGESVIFCVCNRDSLKEWRKFCSVRQLKAIKSINASAK